MKLAELTEKIGARILHQGYFTASEIDSFYAGDKMSDLLNEASETTLIVTNLFNAQLLRFTEIMDVPGVCLLNNTLPEESILQTANPHGTTIIVSPHDMLTTCARLRQCVLHYVSDEEHSTG